jgi:TonB family protein
MHISPVIRAAAAVLLLGGVLPGRTCAQQTPEVLRVNSFTVTLRTDSTTGQDRGFARLWPGGRASGSGTGGVIWACGGDGVGLSAAVMLPALGSSGATRIVNVRFDQDEPMALVLDGENEMVLWYVRDQDIAPLLTRARTADTMTIQMMNGAASGEPSRFTYALAGMDSVQRRLGCAVSPPAAGRLSGREIVRSVVPGVPGSSVEQPRPTNLADLRRFLDRNYPPALREAGVQGEVTLRFRVMEDGWVDSASVHILNSANEAFNPVAIGAVSRLRFRPARAYGTPVKAWVALPIMFVPPALPADSPQGDSRQPSRPAPKGARS